VNELLWVDAEAVRRGRFVMRGSYKVVRSVTTAEDGANRSCCCGYQWRQTWVATVTIDVESDCVLCEVRAEAEDTILFEKLCSLWGTSCSWRRSSALIM